MAASSARSIKKELVPALIGTGVLKELRTQTFLPWNEKTWDTPDVAHDNPADQRFHASLILGFADPAARTAFFEGTDDPAAVADARPRRLGDPRLRRLRSADLRQGRRDPPAYQYEEVTAEEPGAFEPAPSDYVQG